MSRRPLLLAAVFAALATAPACVSKPVVTLHHAEVRALMPQGVGVMLMLQVTNPNSYDVQIRSVRANVTIAGRYPMPPILISPNQWLPSDQTSYVGVPVVVPWTLLPGLVAESAMSQSIPYHVSGSADVSAVRSVGFEKDDVPIDEDGMIPRQLFVNATRGVVGF